MVQSYATDPVMQMERIPALTPRDSTRQVWIFFLCAFAATWGIGLVGLIAPRVFPSAPAFSHTSPFFWMAAYSVSLLGIAMTAYYDGKAGLRRLFGRLLPWRAGPQWYLIVVGGYGLMAVVAFYVSRLYGAAPSSMPGPLAVLTGLGMTLLFDVGPVGEEFGWRGFALPRILVNRSPLWASVILGAVHGLWHLPLFFISTVSQSHLSFPYFVLGTISIAVIDTWIYLRTDANLLLAILVHLMSNYCTGILGAPAYPYFQPGEIIAAIAIVAFGGLRFPARRTTA
jgi:membrane protease YdiL (CAAX protease family)